MLIIVNESYLLFNFIIIVINMVISKVQFVGSRECWNPSCLNPVAFRSLSSGDVGWCFFVCLLEITLGGRAFFFFSILVSQWWKWISCLLPTWFFSLDVTCLSSFFPCHVCLFVDSMTNCVPSRPTHTLVQRPLGRHWFVFFWQNCRNPLIDWCQHTTSLQHDHSREMSNPPFVCDL